MGLEEYFYRLVSNPFTVGDWENGVFSVSDEIHGVFRPEMSITRENISGKQSAFPPIYHTFLGRQGKGGSVPMHLAKWPFWHCLGDRTGSLEDDFCIRRNVQTICVTFNGDPARAPTYSASDRSSGRGILAAMMAAGGIPKTGAHGISLPSFFHIWWIFQMC